MKYLKMLGLAAVAAAALMAFVGAGTASATDTLCKNTAGTECYGVGTEVKSSLVAGTNAVLTPNGPFGETTCEASTVNGKIERATTPAGKITTLSFTKCNNTVTVLKNGELSVHHDAEHNGNVVAKGFEVTVNAGISCIFGGEVKSGLTLTGGAMAKLDATATIPRTGGSFFCPSSAVWHAEYTITAPEPAYVVTGV